jgi:hypothetical protein
MPEQSSTAKPKPAEREGFANDFTVSDWRVVEQAIVRSRRRWKLALRSMFGSVEEIVALLD